MSEEAREFKNTFEPVEGVDYKWVVAYAKEQLAASSTMFKELDEKAGALLTYVGSGAGLLTLGAVAFITDPKIPREVVAAGMPAMIVAMLSLTFAIVSRWTRGVHLPASIQDAAKYAQYFGDRAEAAFVIGQFHHCEVLMRTVLAQKAFWVEWSIRLSVVALVLLLIPLGVALQVGPVALPVPPPAR